MGDGENQGKRRRVKPEENICLKAPERNEYREASIIAQRETLGGDTYREASIIAQRETLGGDTYRETPEMNTDTEIPEFNTHRESSNINSYTEIPEFNTHRESSNINSYTETPEITYRENLEMDSYKETPELNAYNKSPESDTHKKASKRKSYKKVPEVNASKNASMNSYSEKPDGNTYMETSEMITSPETFAYKKVPDVREYREALEQIENFFDQKMDNRRPSRPNATEWKLQRVHTIRVLKEFKEKLDTLQISLKTEKPVANGTISEGAVGSSVGNTMSFFGLTCNPWVTNIGSGLASIPLVANIGRCLVNSTGTGIGSVSNKVASQISEKYLRKIEAALEEDRTLIRPLAEWLNRSNELDNKVQEIFGVSLISDKFNSVIKVFYDILQLSNADRSFGDTLCLLKQGKYSACIGDFVEIEKLQKFHLCLSSSPNLVDRIQRIFSTLKAKPEDVQIFVDGVRVYNSIMGTSAGPTHQGGRNCEIPATTAGEVCVLQTIKLAFRVISFINGASIIRNGTSQYSEPLKQLINSLAWELEKMETCNFK